MTYADRYRLRLKHHRQEIGRAIDYLATRDDIDARRLGWLSISFGSQTMMPLLALEQRVGAAVLIGGGVFLLDLPPAEQPYNYLPRVRQPVLMLSGRWTSTSTSTRRKPCCGCSARPRTSSSASCSTPATLPAAQPVRARHARLV